MIGLPATTANELAAIYLDHVAFCAATSIRNKSGQVVPLISSPAQLKLNRAIARQEARGLPVRGICLKGRQVHMSVGVTAEYWRRAAFQPGTKVRVFADVSRNADNIFDYWRQMITNYRPLEGLRQLACGPDSPYSWRSNQFIEFEGGGSVMFESADNAKGGRSHSTRLLHNTELAFWRDAASLRTGLLSSVPAEPGTMVIDESTPFGTGGSFYDAWQRASDPSSASEYFALFFGWHEHPEYQKLVTDPYQFQKSLTDVEHALQKRFNLTLAQLNWRRWKIANDLEGDERRFRQEFPSDAEEGFLVSGRPRFDRDCLVSLPVVQQPTVGEIHELDIGVRKDVSFVANSEGRGALRLYRRPMPNRRYTIGVDVAQGIDIALPGSTPDPDYSAGQVLDADTGEQCAVAHVRLEPGAFAEYIYLLGKWYGWAWIVAENNGPGLAFMMRLMQLAYPVARIYGRRREPDDRRPLALQELGWKSGVATRPRMVSQLDGALRSRQITIYDAKTKQELTQFVIGASGKAEGAQGAHDDLVIGLGLAVEGVATCPAIQQPESVIYKPVQYGRIYRGNSRDEDHDADR